MAWTDKPKYSGNMIFDEEPFCEKCEHLDIRTETAIIYYDDKPIITTNIKCRYLEKCRQLHAHLLLSTQE